MTENKSLKARVRARMARTGESYTTAHRHVVTARAPGSPGHAEPTGLVPGYPLQTGSGHRPSALTAHLLAQSGVELTDTLACGLGGGIGFLYAVFEYKQLGHPLLTVVAQHHPTPWLEATAHHLGVELDTQHSSSPRAALTKLDAALSDGKAVEVLVSRGSLPWHPGGDPMEAAEPYPVVVVGARGEDFLVEDLPGELTKVDRKTLGVAWGAHRKGRHQMTVVAAIPDPVDEPTAIRRALRLTVDHLSGPVLGHAFDVNFGLSGMAKLAAELRDTGTKAGWVRRFGDPAKVGYAAGRLADCLTTSYTAQGGTRPLYAEFLDEVSVMLDAPPLADAAALVAESGREWTALASLAGEAAEGAVPVDPTALFGRMADHVTAAMQQEETAVMVLDGWLGS